MNELVIPSAQEPSAEQQFLAVIERMASNPDVDVSKLSAILDMQERIIAKRAESEFNEAFAIMSPKLPRIKKTKDVIIKEVKQYSYATWETIDEAIRPILNEHGFSLSFNTEPRQSDGGGLIVTGTLLHRAGHSKKSSIGLSIENSGSKNNVQGLGSTFSYGKRYTTTMLLNLTTVNDDDDGQRGGTVYITPAQIGELKALIEKGVDEMGFLRYAGVLSLNEIETKNFPACMNMLSRKVRAIEAAKEPVK